MNPRRFLRDLLKTLRRHRRLLAGLTAAVAVYCALTALSPDPPPTVGVLAATRDLPGGAVPSDADLRTLRLPPDALPAGVLRPGAELAARPLNGPVRAGEPLTDARFLSAAAIPAGQLAYPFRLEDQEIAALLRVGDHVNVYAATSTAASTAALIAPGARVLSLPAPRASGGALVVITTTPAVATRLAQAAAGSRLTVALTPDTG